MDMEGTDLATVDMEPMHIQAMAMVMQDTVMGIQEIGMVILETEAFTHQGIDMALQQETGLRSRQRTGTKILKYEATFIYESDYRWERYYKYHHTS